MDGMLPLLLLWLLKYYPEEKLMNFTFGTKAKRAKYISIVILKGEPDLKSRFFYIIWTASADKIFETNSNFHVK